MSNMHLVQMANMHRLKMANMEAKPDVNDEIAKYQESIERRTAPLKKLCDEYRRAETEYVNRREHRAFVEKRLKERLQYSLKIKKKRTLGSSNEKWSGGLFGVLASRSGGLAMAAKLHPMKPRVREHVTALMRDLDLILRYFERQLESIQRNKSEHRNEGRRVSRQLRNVFAPLRDLLTFFADALVPLKSTELQEMTLDGLQCKALQEKAAKAGVTEIKRLMGDSATIQTAGTPQKCAKRRVSMRWLQRYTWKLSRRHRSRVEQLCLASADGDTKQVQLLLNLGTYINGTRTADKTTPLLCAIKNSKGAVDIIQLLLQHGADTAGAFMAAVETRDTAIVKLLVENDKSNNINTRHFNASSHYGITALCRAAELGLSDIVFLLLSRGADWRITYCDHTMDLHKISALHIAKEKCATHIHSISKGQGDYFAASAKDSNQRIPLFWALERQDWIAAAACDPHWTSRIGAVDVDGNTVMHVLCKALADGCDSSRAALSALQSVANSNGDLVRCENHARETALQLLAAAGAVAPQTELVAAITRATLQADFHSTARRAHPEDYVDERIIYCFGSRPQMTDEEQEAHLKRWRMREEHEAAVQKEQDDLFQGYVQDYITKQQKADGH